MVVKAAISFLREDTDADFIVNVGTALDGTGAETGTFPNPVPPINTVKTALDDFVVAKGEAVKGGKQATAVKKAKRAIVVSLMRQLANYVTDTSDGDMTKLLSSKFPTQKPTRQRVGKLTTPSTPTLKYTKISGELDASTPPITGAYTYNWRLALATAPDVYVQTAQTIGGRNLFAELTPGQNYLVQVCAVGAAGPSDWSNTAKLMVV